MSIKKRGHVRTWPKLMGLAAATAAATFLSAVGLPLEVQAAPTAVQATSRADIEQAVQQALNRGENPDVIVRFHGKADLSAAYAITDRDARATYVYDTLRSFARQSQIATQQMLQRNFNLNAESQGFTELWINNSIAIPHLTAPMLSALAASPDVESIQTQKIIPLPVDEVSEGDAQHLDAVIGSISHIKAPDVWNLGYNGSGIVVANIDAGVRHTHTTLVNSYRGNTGGGTFNHNYNWYDPYNHAGTPRWTHDHGTHTMGTMVGDDASHTNQIGVAPGAKWIACIGFGLSGAAASDAGLLECGQWMIAPYATSGTGAGDPTKHPDIVNNSWGDCGRTYDDWYEDVIDGWIAAGIVPVFSNGNNSNCSYPSNPPLNTVGNPGRSGKVLGIGSTGNTNGQYAPHSNKGPTDNPNPGGTTYPDPRGFADLKPNVSAPGVSITSAGAASDTALIGMSGTSMSAPAASGVIALMWSAAPCLHGNYAKTGTLLMSTAIAVPVNTGSTSDGPGNVPNQATGWGEIDALAAVNAAIAFCDGSGGSDPVASITPTSLSLSAAQGSTDSAPITIANTGGGSLTYTVTESAASNVSPTSSYLTSQNAFAKGVLTASGSLNKAPAASNGAHGSPITLNAADISQMADNTPGDEGVSCGVQGTSTADNSWWRRFYFNEHPAVGASTSVTSVTVSTGSIDVGGLPATVNLYTLPHSTAVDTIPTGSLTLIGTANTTLTGSLQSITVPVTGTVSDTGASDLVVEIHTDGNASGGQFFPGANATAETHPTYLSSATCGLTAPTKAADIGFPDFHMTMVVTVDGDTPPPAGCDNPSDIPWLSESPTSGSVAGGSSAAVTVSANAGSMAPGTYTANVCVATNDPAHAMTTVPVSLTVTQGGGGGDEVLVVDLSTVNQVTITAGNGTSQSTLSGSTTTGFLFQNLFANAGTQAIGTSTIVGTATLTAASVPPDGSPSLFRSSDTDAGLNIWSYSATSTTTFTAGQPAFAGTATWTITPALYAAMLTAPTTGDVYFPADDSGDIAAAAQLIGSYKVVTGGSGGDPAIDVSPANLSASQAANTTTTQTLAISNTGGGSLDWTITEAMPNGTGVAERLSPRSAEHPVFVRDYSRAPMAEVIQDGSYELGSPNPYWDDDSLNFGTVLCTIDLCGTGLGVGAHSGSWWAWFGGIDAHETGHTYQDVTIASGTATLSFWLQVPSSSFLHGDYLAVSIDDDEVFRVTADDATAYADYAKVTIDVSDYADGGEHTVKFDSEVLGGAGVSTNFMVDDVSLDATDGGVGGGCANPTDVSWASVSPASGSTAGGATSNVTVTFDSNGLPAGTYNGLLCVASNDAATPSVEVPVSMTVTSGGGGGDPIAAVTPTSLSFTVAQDASGDNPLSIANVGGGSLTWNITESTAAATRFVSHPYQAPTIKPNAVGTLSRAPASNGDVHGSPITLNAMDISQMADNTPGDQGVSCGVQGTSTADNSWWRRFYFDEHPAVGASTGVTSVTISTGSIDVGGLPVTVNLYTLPHSAAVDTIPTGSLTQIGTASATLTGALESITVPVTGTVSDTAGMDLVVEIHTDGNTAGGQFFPGANATAETHPTYLSSATCGLTAPTKAADIGFPDFHLTMVVTLDGDAGPTGCDNPSDIPWLSASPASGNTAGGATSTSTITANTAGMAPGTYSANICVATNDPANALVTVPVSLTVTSGGGGGDIVCNAPNHTFAQTVAGTSANWASGAVDDTDATGYDVNWWNNGGLTVYWSSAPAISAAVAPSTSSSDVSVLAAGTVVGPSSTWSRTGGPMTAFRAGVDGYMGFRFQCDAGTCYGYAHLTTTAGSGYPATLVDYCYDESGAAITIGGGGGGDEDPAIQVTPNPMLFSVEAGASSSNPLTVKNVGLGGPLTYSIAEAPSARPTGSFKTAAGRLANKAGADVARGGNTVAANPYAGSRATGQSVTLNASDISQMADNTPGDQGVSCGVQGTSTADNSWWRRFYFDEHPAVGASTGVTSVTISTGSIDVGGLPVTVNLYTLPHSAAVDTIPTGSLTQIGTASATLTGALESITVPVTGTVSDTAGMDLVVEIHTDGNTAGGQFFPGANATPETHPTYLSSATCGLTAPTKAADIGFPDFHLTMVVTVDGDGGGTGGGCQNPSDVPWLSVTPTSGSLAAGAQADSTVTVNAASLTAGTYSANLCVTSNDPANALVTVPVNVTVTPGTVTPCSAADTIFCDGFDPEGGDGGPFTQPLQDPSFEATTTDAGSNPFWTGTDSNDPTGGTPFYSASSFGIEVHTGDWEAWFGGWRAQSEVQTFSQTVDIAAGGSRYVNYWRNVVAAPDGTATLKIYVDGTVVSTKDVSAWSADLGLWVNESVDITAQAGGSHTIKFEFTFTGNDDGNLFIDDVTIDDHQGSMRATSTH